MHYPGSGVPEASIKWEDPEVKLKAILNKKNVKGTGSIGSMLTEAPLPFAIAIMKTEDLRTTSALTELKLGGTVISLPITPAVENTLRKHVVDMVVYKRKSQLDSCNLFNRIAPQLQNKVKYVLRDYAKDAPAEPIPGPSSRPTPIQPQLSLSLNRCTASMDAFVPETFKLANPTPNKANDCQNGFRFVLEKYARELFPELIDNIQENNIEEGTCSISTVAEILTAKNLDKAINTIISHPRDSCVPVHLSSLEQGDTISALAEAEDRLLRHRVTVQPSVSEQKRDGYSSRIANMKKHQSNIMPVEWLEKNSHKLQSWLEYIFNQEKPVESKVRCSLCYDNRRNPILNQNYKNDFASEAGTIKSNSNQMRDEVNRHNCNRKKIRGGNLT